MTEEFNKWWSSDVLSEENPYWKDSPAYWAYEGWLAGVNSEREMCAKVVEKAGVDGYGTIAAALLVRERGAP